MRKIIMPTALALTLAALTGCDKTGAENQQTLLKYLEKQGELQKSISQTQETLVSLGRENAELRKDLLAVQEKLKGPVNTDTLKSIDGAIQISTCPDPRIRKTVCTILGQFAGPQAEARLVELTNKDADAQVRVSALTSLSEMSSSKLPTVLPSKLSSDSGEERVVAVNLMLKAPKPEYKAALLAMLAEVPSGDNNWSIQNARAAAYRAVRTLVGPSDFASLKSACQRDKGEAKRAALSTLLATCSDAGAVLELLKDNTEASVLDESAITGLRAIADIRLTPCLLPLCKNNDWRARIAVYELLGKLRDPLAAPMLKERLSSETDSDCKRTIQVLLQSYPGVILNGNQAQLVSDAEMKVLLDARAKQLEALQKTKV